MFDLVLEDAGQGGDRHAILVHGVPVADGDGMVVEGVEVHGDTVGGADLVLAAVAAADALGVVVLGVENAAELVVDGASGGDKTVIPAEGQDGDGNGSELAVEVQDGAGGVAVGFLIEGVEPEG